MALVRSCEEGHLGTDSMTSLMHHPDDSEGIKLFRNAPTANLSLAFDAAELDSAPAIADAFSAASRMIKTRAAIQQASSRRRAVNLANIPGWRLTRPTLARPTACHKWQ